MLRTVLIYRDRVLPPSETFIQSQAAALSRFTPVYVGSRRVTDGLSLPAEDVIVANNGAPSGRLNEFAYRWLGVAPAFKNTLRRTNAVLIHAHFGIDAMRASWLARELRVPLIATFHGYDVTTRPEHVRRRDLSHRLYLQRKAALQRDGSLFIAVSEFIRGKMLEQGFPAERTIVHYIGIDTALFRSDPGITREPIVLFVGRLVEVKGCEYLIRAMQLVQRQLPRAELVIIGDGPLRGRLEESAGRSVRQCTFLGRQPPTVVRAWMNRARVLAAPSVAATSGAEEAFGIVSTEAQSMGLPVVAARSGGIPEAVADQQTGTLVGERDESALAAGIHQLLTDEDKWAAFSAAGRARVRRLFDLRTQTARLEDLYDQVLVAATPTAP